MRIQIATRQDSDAIRKVHLAAFPDAENEMIAQLAIALLTTETTPPTISLVAQAEGAIAGHVAFSPVSIAQNDRWQGYILAPLAVLPDYQKRGIGSQLIKTGLQQLVAMGVNTLFVYGDPNYYGRFGFSADAAEQYTLPYTLEYPFGWQAIALKDSNLPPSPCPITCVQALSIPELW